MLLLALAVTLSACQRQSEVTLYQESSAPPEEETIETIYAAAGEETSQEETATEENNTDSREEECSRALIVWFSRWGNTEYSNNTDADTSASIVVDGDDRYGTTEYMARMIQENTGGDMQLIRVEKPYPEDFDAVVDQNHREMEEETFPELLEMDLDLSQYDTVFIGYPIWATTLPRPILSFLQEYDLTGKTVVPFCTHGGYGSGNSYRVIEQMSSGAQILDGLAIEDEDIQKADTMVAQWLESIGVTQERGVSEQASETPITITIGDIVLDGVIYDTDLANEIRDTFPLTVSMVGFGGREYYGGIDFTPVNVGTGQLNFINGDITYCGRNNSMAIFYAQTDSPNLTMEVIPLGRVTSDLAIFDELPGTVDIRFELAIN